VIMQLGRHLSRVTAQSKSMTGSWADRLFAADIESEVDGIDFSTSMRSIIFFESHAYRKALRLRIAGFTDLFTDVFADPPQ
jgi:hypothetical protein